MTATDEQLYGHVLTYVRSVNSQRPTTVSASGVAQAMGVADARLVAEALQRAVREGLLRGVVVHGCGACGTAQRDAGPRRCRSCSVEAPAVDFHRYTATEALMASGSPVPPPSARAVPDRLEDVDRVIPLEADAGGIATATRSAAVDLARIRRSPATWIGVGVALVALAVGVRQAQLAAPPVGRDIPPTGTVSASAGRALAASSVTLYATEDEARARCGAQKVVFANARSRIWHPQGDSMYGIYRNGPFPQRGYGCADDLAAAGYHASRGF